MDGLVVHFWHLALKGHGPYHVSLFKLIWLAERAERWVIFFVLLDFLIFLVLLPIVDDSGFFFFRTELDCSKHIVRVFIKCNPLLGEEFKSDEWESSQVKRFLSHELGTEVPNFDLLEN